MIVNNYSDYVAYTFEENDSIFMIGTKYINKSEIVDIIPAIEVKHNNMTQFLYGTENYKFVADVAQNIANSELVIVLKKFIDAMFTINETDYISVTAVDVKYERLYYDPKSKAIKIILLPINYECDYHDGEEWSSSFRRMLLMLLSYIFKDAPEKYQEVYYAIMDEEKNNYDVLLYMHEYEFGVRQVEDMPLNFGESQNMEHHLILSHNSSVGNLIFRITKDEYVIGKADNMADGVIAISNMISRAHCKIYRNSGSYMVEDMNSTNGTCINGYVLSPGELYYIYEGDILSLADMDFNVMIE